MYSTRHLDFTLARTMYCCARVRKHICYKYKEKALTVQLLAKKRIWVALRIAAKIFGGTWPKLPVAFACFAVHFVHLFALPSIAIGYPVSAPAMLG